MNRADRARRAGEEILVIMAHSYWLLLCAGTLMRRPTAVATAAAHSRFTTYSCDTGPVTAAGKHGTPPASFGGNVYSAIRIGHPPPVNETTTHGPRCESFNASSDPLGPCFASPASAKSYLDTIPAGHRAISLEGQPTLYTIQIGNVTTPRHLACFDPIADGVRGPWLDAWSHTVHYRFERWFGQFHELGGDVDIVMLDWENNAAFFEWVAQPGAAAALIADARWPALRAELNRLAAHYNVSFPVAPTQAEMQGWSRDRADIRPWIWNDVVDNRLVARALNASIVAPVSKLYPKVVINNFSHKHRREPSPGRWWPYEQDSATPPAGTGAHVGTHQGGAFYGGSNRSKVLITTGLDVETVLSTDASPFNVLLQSAAVASDMVSAAPNIPVLPWIEPDTTSYAGGYPTLRPIWSEHLFHLSMRLSTRRFLWWRAGDDYPLTRGMATLSTALHELDAVMTVATDGAWSAAGGETCSFSAISSLNAKPVTWLDPYIVSGVNVQCPSSTSSVPSKQAQVWRLTFRCHVPMRDEDNRQCAYPTAPGEWHIAGGVIVQPVPGGKMLNVSGGVQTGFWFVQY